MPLVCRQQKVVRSGWRTDRNELKVMKMFLRRKLLKLQRNIEFYTLGQLKLDSIVYPLKHEFVLDLRGRLNTLVGFGDEIFKSSQFALSA